jgi:GAF domain-containing protein
MTQPMNQLSRESKLNEAFVTLADTLTDDYDIVELLHTLVERCADILDTQAGGIMLVDPLGNLQLIASTSEEVSLVEIMQLNAGAGPCVDCFTSGKPVTIGDIEAETQRWPDFGAEALRRGFRSVHATPLRLRGQVLGAMNLFSVSTGELKPEDISVAQSLADVATIGILQERSIRKSGALNDQLQYALDSRILVEQAKGVLSESEGMNMDEAFAALRAYARIEKLGLRSVAAGVVNRSLSAKLFS